METGGGLAGRVGTLPSPLQWHSYREVQRATGPWQWTRCGATGCNGQLQRGRSSRSLWPPEVSNCAKRLAVNPLLVSSIEGLRIG
jgi:hypothetical protein